MIRGGLRYWVIAAAMATNCALAVQPTKVAPNGETSSAATIGKLAILVKIKTHEREIGKPSDMIPSSRESSCTYSRFPCSVVDRLDISVNGSPLFVPRSAFCDLADLNLVEIKAFERGVVLVLHGGDASESYKAIIEFDASEIKRRTLSSAMAPAQVLQETIYHSQSVWD